MKWLALLALMPVGAMAQSAWPYASVVHECYEAATSAGREVNCIGDAATLCMETEANGYSTVGMMFCLSDEAGVWDDLLNEYAMARAFAQEWDEVDRPQLPQYAVRDEQVLQAQRAWLTFRDANCTMAYGRYGAGTLRQVSNADCYMRMTAERTLELEQYRGPMR